MNRKMQSAVTKTQNRRMQIGKTDNEKAKWGSLGPRHANEIKNWCFGAIGANISRQIQIYTSIYTWIYSLSPACCKQMSFNKLKMWANWRMASERARGWAAGGGAVRGLSPMGVWKVRCFSMPDWFCGVGGGGVCGWQAPPGSQAVRQRQSKCSHKKDKRRQIAANFWRVFLMKLPKRLRYDDDDRDAVLRSGYSIFLVATSRWHQLIVQCETDIERQRERKRKKESERGKNWKIDKLQGCNKLSIQSGALQHLLFSLQYSLLH